eukprot:16432832-Heterocapsa_arctica.AAC.1
MTQSFYASEERLPGWLEWLAGWTAGWLAGWAAGRLPGRIVAACAAARAPRPRVAVARPEKERTHPPRTIF